MCAVSMIFGNGPEVSQQVSDTETQTQTDSSGVAEAQAAEEIIPVPEDLIIQFAFDRSDFQPGEETARYVNGCKAYLEQEAGALLRITGHTDATGTVSYNQGSWNEAGGECRILLYRTGHPGRHHRNLLHG
jgi:outer membrane protein OmpA-like peptidoglycan-associated protein